MCPTRARARAQDADHMSPGAKVLALVSSSFALRYIPRGYIISPNIETASAHAGPTHEHEHRVAHDTRRAGVVSMRDPLCCYVCVCVLIVRGHSPNVNFTVDLEDSDTIVWCVCLCSVAHAAIWSRAERVLQEQQVGLAPAALYLCAANR